MDGGGAKKGIEGMVVGIDGIAGNDEVIADNGGRAKFGMAGIVVGSCETVVGFMGSVGTLGNGGCVAVGKLGMVGSAGIVGSLCNRLRAAWLAGKLESEMTITKDRTMDTLRAAIRLNDD